LLRGQAFPTALAWLHYTVSEAWLLCVAFTILYMFLLCSAVLRLWRQCWSEWAQQAVGQGYEKCMYSFFIGFVIEYAVRVAQIAW